jgi:hypothetical protein
MVAASERHAPFDWSVASPSEKIEGLLAYLGKVETLCEGTVSHYVQCAQVAIERILGQDEDEAIDHAAAAARRILVKRIGTPEPARGSSLKHKDPSLQELGDVFSHLRSKFLESGDRIDLLLALYIIVMPRIGLRPVEITWAAWDGNGLYTYTAKRTGRPKRYIPNEHWPPVFKMALGLFVKLVPRELDDVAFEAWRNLLASRLARASKWTRTKKRLSLYFARHIAIANWKQAGISAEVIARLAGHAGLRSQHHYASGRSGYGSRYVFLNSADAKALLGLPTDDNFDHFEDKVDHEVQAARTGNGLFIEPQEAAVSAEAEDPGKREQAFVLDEMPAPRPKEKENSQLEGERLWEEAKLRQQADWKRIDTVTQRIPMRKEQVLPRQDADPESSDQHDEDGPTGDQRR